MKLGFDIDDTLINLREHAFHIYNRKLGRNVGLDVFNALPTLAIHDAFGLTLEEGRQMWSSSRDEIYYTDCPPFPHAVEVLQELDAQGHEVYYITARPAEHCERTKAWLVRNRFPVGEGRFFCGMNDTEKVHIIHELGLDYYFDDKPAVLDTLADSTARVYAKDNPYNKHLDIPRIVSWHELRDIVKQSS